MQNFFKKGLLILNNPLKNSINQTITMLNRGLDRIETPQYLPSIQKKRIDIKVRIVEDKRFSKEIVD
jgi:hypothetical protein